jgi:tetratricopeptide (TPR) repeat protein
MTRRTVSFLLLLCCLAAAALAQKPEGKPAEKSADTQDYTQESFVVEQVRTSYRFEKDGTGRKELYARVKVQSEAGVEQWGQVVVGYNSANEKIQIPYVRVHKSDGSTITAPADAVQDLSAPLEHDAPVYTDYRQKHITVPGLRPGEILEYDIVTVIHTPLAQGQFWMEHEFDKSNIVLNEQLDVDVPRDRKVKLKSKPGSEPKIAEEKERRIYRWTNSNLVRDDDEKDKAKQKELAKKKKKDRESPDVQLTTFASWEELGNWYAGLERDRRVPSAEIRAKQEALTQGLKTDSEKIQALYDYVATNFRYVSLSLGVGRYQPHAAADVFHNQYGDCKDKHTLLEAMLGAAGFRASSVLINSSRKLDPDIPSPSQFDHVISLLPLGKDEIWMDTTTEVAPYRLLAFGLRKKQALVVPPDGVPHLEETPADPPNENVQLQEIDGKVNELGKLTARVHLTVRGDTELLVRVIFRRVPSQQWKRLVENISTAGGLDGEVSDLKVGDPTATRQPFELEYQITKTNYFDWSKKKSDLNLPFAQAGLPAADEDETGDDDDPIKFGPPGENIYKMKLELPAKYSVRTPLPFAMKRDYADYQATYKLEGNVFTAERKMVVHEREIPATRTRDYLAFRRAVLSDFAQHVSIETSVAGTPTPPKDLKADELVESGISALQSGNIPMSEQLLKRAVEVDPKHKSAWNALGSAYLSERRTDDAIAAFQKQIEVNPYDEFAYANMGRAYWQDRKYEAAVVAFRKQIEVNPLDKFAHANLGTMYAEWHKYDEAVPELEKAVSLSPEDPLLQVNLGDAYLNLGKDDQALQAFDRAVNISATPVVWNNIAYQLSVKHAHLDKAQQYAESAVAATVAELRNLRLEQLNPRDLALVPSLTAYWDTLGWVYFGRGDLEKAEKYVSAAWALGQHGEVGDHLGQIYEKRGKKEEAIHTYALALQGLRPVQETRDRLAALVGGEKNLPAILSKYKTELQDARTVNVGKLTNQTANADFFILLSPSSAGMVPESVKFVSGDDKLRGLGDALRKADYKFAMPDDTPAKILRRGSLSCAPDAGCKFVMLLTDDVRSVD